MRYHLAQLQAFCEAHPVDEKVLVVPALTVGHDVTAALAGAGVSWVNLRVETPRSLAESVVGVQKRAEGWRPLVPDGDLFWVDAAIPEAVREAGDGYFAQQAAGLARPFLRTLHALRAAGVAGDALDGEGERHRLLRALCRAYNGALATHRVYDNAMLYEWALARLEEEVWDVPVAVLDETPLPGLAFEFLKAFSRGQVWRIGRGDYGVGLPQHCAAVRFGDVDVVEGDVGAGGQVLMSGLAVEDREVVRLVKTLGVETEIAALLRDLRETGGGLDEVEVVYTVAQPYVHVLCDVMQRFEIPATFSDGVPVTATGVGQAVVNFYRWMGGGFQAEEWVVLCRAGLVHFGEVTANRVAVVIQQARVGEGRGRYGEALNRVKAGMAEQGDEDGVVYRGLTVEEVDAVMAVMAQVFALIPEGPNVSVRELVDAGLGFLSKFVVDAGRWDGEAREAIEARLGEVADERGPMRRLANRLAELMGGLSFGASASKPGHLAVGPLSRAGYTGRSQVYIVGMDEGSFPGGATEDPLLLDGERSGLSGELMLHRTRPAEQVWHAVRVMGMASGCVTLSSCRRSLAGGRERYPAALVQQAAEQMGVEELPVVQVLPEAVELGLDDGEVLLASFPFVGYEALVQGMFPWLQAGQKARQARRWGGLTRYDGWLGGPTPELAITMTGRVFSPSALERLAQCPYRYFLNDVLQIYPVDEPESDPTRWLHPQAFGSLLHIVFKEFMQTVTARGETPDREQHDGLMEEVLGRAIEARKETDPVVHEAAFRADVKRLSQAAKVFLAVESDAAQGTPVGFEVSFGFGESGPLHQAEPVEVDLAKDVGFRIRGRIDRVDVLDEGFAIWDYKTGSMRPYDEQDLLKRGTHLQWALYACALDAVLKQQKGDGQVVQSGYVFPGDREHGRRISDRPPEPEALAHALRPLLELVAGGGFFHVQKTQACEYCAYNRVCGGERVDAKALDGVRETMAEDRDFEGLVDSLNRWMGV